MSDSEVLAIQRDYPRIFLACHVEHARASRNPYGVSARESGILSHLDPTWPQSPGRLAAHLGVGPSALSASIARLESLGHLERRAAGSDRRRMELRLTPRGVEALQAGSVLDTTRLTALLHLLSPKERGAACRGLSLLARAAGKLNERKGRARAARRRVPRSTST